MQPLTFLYDKDKVADRQRQALAWLADTVRWETVLTAMRDQEERQNRHAA